MISIILAGGSGVRFWPLSRESHPKQLLNIAGEHTLIQDTVERLLPWTPIDRIYIITNEQHALETISQLAAYGFKADHLIAEPVGRNTAPAVALAAELFKDQPDEIMAVFPADHVVNDPDAFRDTLRQAETAAKQNHLVTLGVKPTGPETGYGYILKGGALENLDNTFKVSQFTEKPDRETAEHFIQQKKYYWNCGIFAWKVSTIRNELQQHAPKIIEPLAGIGKHLQNVKGKFPYRLFDGKGKKIFESLPSISIDYAVMEPSQNAVVVPTTMPWKDIGAWNALDDISQADGDGNVLSKDVYQVDCTGTIVKADGRLIGAVGLKDMIVVDTEDALLICPKDRAQDVKQLVEQLKDQKRPETKLHATVQKPWGLYTTLEKREGYLLKRIEVLAGESLSLQSHRHRAEHWLVVSGKAEVQCGDQTFTLEPGQTTVIPKGAKHRLANPGKKLLILIETQFGKILDEDDITRYNDLYGRA
ncbi:MAG: mannose-1-phosphate guanylyltransferase/mannose-6-phosphate isomerase [Nitrospinae bacterium]|nr:mannose-1-phosphate guanylyltransferase/mannose-6-phosphate isomerase [Nitrospinota bacterium]